MRVDLPELGTFIDFPDDMSPQEIQREIDRNWDAMSTQQAQRMGVSPEQFQQAQGAAFGQQKIPSAEGPDYNLSARIARNPVVGPLVTEPAKALERGFRETAASIGGAGVEAAGGAFATMTQGLRDIGLEQPLGAPIPNPLEGQSQVARQTFQPNLPRLQPSQRMQDTTYTGALTEMATGEGPSGGRGQAAVDFGTKLVSDTLGIAPSMAATVAGFLMAGPAGAGAMGGFLEGASQYEKAKAEGKSEQKALQELTTVGVGTGVLNAIPFIKAFDKVLPDQLKGYAANFLLRGAVEGATETAEGALPPLAELDRVPRTTKEATDLLVNMGAGIYDESGVFLPAALTGGIMGGAATAPRRAAAEQAPSNIGQYFARRGTQTLTQPVTGQQTLRRPQGVVYQQPAMPGLGEPQARVETFAPLEPRQPNTPDVPDLGQISRPQESLFESLESASMQRGTPNLPGRGVPVIPNFMEGDTPSIQTVSPGPQDTSGAGPYGIPNIPQSPMETLPPIRQTPKKLQRFETLFDEAAAQTGVQPDILMAIAQVESGGNPKAVSPKGAKGIMQIIDATAQELGIQDATDPKQAIPAAARYLARGLERHNGDLDLALADYNAGPGNVDKYGGVPPFKETQEYIRKVRSAMAAIQGDIVTASLLRTPPDKLQQIVDTRVNKGKPVTAKEVKEIIGEGDKESVKPVRDWVNQQVEALPPVEEVAPLPELRAAQAPEVAPSPATPLPESILASFPDLSINDSGLISINQFTQAERDALREAGLIEEGTLSTGEKTSGVDPEKLWPLRQAAQAAQKPRKVDEGEAAAARERRASFYDRLAEEQESLGEYGDQEAAEKYRAKAAEIRSRGPASGTAQPASNLSELPAQPAENAEQVGDAESLIKYSDGAQRIRNSGLNKQDANKASSIFKSRFKPSDFVFPSEIDAILDEVTSGSEQRKERKANIANAEKYKDSDPTIYSLLKQRDEAASSLEDARSKLPVIASQAEQKMLQRGRVQAQDRLSAIEDKLADRVKSLSAQPPPARQQALSTAAQNLAAIEGKAEPVVSEGQSRAFERLTTPQPGIPSEPQSSTKNSTRYVTPDGKATSSALDELAELLSPFGKNARYIAEKISNDDFSIQEYELLVSKDRTKQEAFEAADDAWNEMGEVWNDNNQPKSKITRDSALIMPYARTKDTINTFGMPFGTPSEQMYASKPAKPVESTLQPSEQPPLTFRRVKVGKKNAYDTTVAGRNVTIDRTAAEPGLPFEVRVEGQSAPVDFFRTLGEAKDYISNTLRQEMETEAQGDVEPAQPVVKQELTTEPKQPWEMTREEFEKQDFYLHKDIRAKTQEERDANRDSILQKGLERRGPSAINTLPAYRGGNPTDIIDKKYAPKAGERGYLIPKKFIDSKGNFVAGFNPGPSGVVDFTKDYQSVHEAIIETALASGKPVPPAVLAEYPDLAAKYAQPTPKESSVIAPQPSGETGQLATPRPIWKMPFKQYAKERMASENLTDLREIADREQELRRVHRRAVQDAIAAGEKVPVANVKEYGGGASIGVGTKFGNETTGEWEVTRQRSDGRFELKVPNAPKKYNTNEPDPNYREIYSAEEVEKLIADVPERTRLLTESMARQAISREKRAKQDAVEAKRKADEEDVDGFDSSLSPMAKKKVQNILNKVVSDLDGKSMTRKQRIRNAVAAGTEVKKSQDGSDLIYFRGGKIPTTNGGFVPGDGFIFVTKTEADYAKYLLRKRDSAGSDVPVANVKEYGGAVAEAPAAPAKVLYDDDYEGPRYTYGLTYRPVGMATLPKGWIVQSNRQSPEFTHGTIDFPRELTPEEVRSYELTPIGKSTRKGASRPVASPSREDNPAGLVRTSAVEPSQVEAESPSNEGIPQTRDSLKPVEQMTKRELVEELAGSPKSDYTQEQQRMKLVRSLNASSKEMLADSVSRSRADNARQKAIYEKSREVYNSIASRVEAAGAKWQSELRTIAGEYGTTVGPQSTKGEMTAIVARNIAEKLVTSAPAKPAPAAGKVATTKTYKTPEGYIEAITPVIKQMLEGSNASNVITKAAGRKLSRNDEIAVVSEWVKDMRSKGEMAMPTDFAGISEEQAYFLEPILKKLSLTQPTPQQNLSDLRDQAREEGLNPIEQISTIEQPKEATKPQKASGVKLKADGTITQKSLISDLPEPPAGVPKYVHASGGRGIVRYAGVKNGRPVYTNSHGYSISVVTDVYARPATEETALSAMNQRLSLDPENKVFQAWRDEISRAQPVEQEKAQPAPTTLTSATILSDLRDQAREDGLNPIEQKKRNDRLRQAFDEQYPGSGGKAFSDFMRTGNPPKKPKRGADPTNPQAGVVNLDAPKAVWDALYDFGFRQFVGPFTASRPGARAEAAAFERARVAQEGSSNRDALIKKRLAKSFAASLRSFSRNRNDQRVLRDAIDGLKNGTYRMAPAPKGATKETILQSARDVMSGKSNVLLLPERLQKSAQAQREFLDAASQYLLENEIATTEGQKAAVKKGIGLWLRRSYEVHDNPNWVSEVQGKPVWNAALDAMQAEWTEATQTPESLTDLELIQFGRRHLPGVKNAKALNEIEKVLAENPTADTLPADSRAQIESALRELPQRSRAEFSNRLTSILAEMAQEGREGVLSNRLGSQNRTSLMRRKTIPKWMRDVMGEYTEPEINFARSAEIQAQMIAAWEFSKSLYEAGKGTFIFDSIESIPDNLRTAFDRGEFRQVPDNAKYGMLAGKYMSKELREALDQKRPEYDLPLRVLSQISGSVRWMKTIGNVPSGYIRNFFSSMFAAASRGDVPIATMVKVASGIRAGKGFDRSMAEAIGIPADNSYSMYKKLQDHHEKMVKLGVHDTDPTANLVRERLRNGLFGKGEFDPNNPHVLRKINELATNSWLAGDNFWKSISFMENVNRYESYAKKQGWTQEQLERHAADVVRATSPTYDAAFPIVNKLKNSSLNMVWQDFMTWPAERIRNKANLLKLIGWEMKSGDKALQASAAGRLVTMISSHAIMTIALGTLGQWALGGDDEDEDWAVRSLLPDWMRYAPIYHFGKTDKGEYGVLDLGFSDPDSMMNKVLLAAYEGNYDDAAMELVNTFLGTSIAYDTFEQIRMNRKQSGAPVFFEHDNAWEKLVKSARFASVETGPPLLALAWQAYERTQGKKEEIGTRTIGDRLWSFTGFSNWTINPERSFGFKAKNAAKHFRDIRGEISRESTEYPERKLRDIEKAMADKRDKYAQDLVEFGVAAKIAGVSTANIRKQLKEASIREDYITKIMQGINRSYDNMKKTGVRDFSVQLPTGDKAKGGGGLLQPMKPMQPMRPLTIPGL